MPHASLPEDINALKQLVIEQRALLAAKDEQLLSRDVLIEKLKIELLRLKRMRFGRSSERLDEKIAQLELTLEELEANQSQIAPAATAITEERPAAHEAGSQGIAFPSAARECRAYAGVQLRELRRQARAPGRGCERGTGVRALALQSDPPRPPEVRLQGMPEHHA